MQSVPITTNVECSNPTQEIHYVIKFVSDFRQVSGFLDTLISSSNKIDRHVIPEILLKVTLNTITLTSFMNRKFKQWWSTFPPISIKQTTTPHLKPLSTKKTTAYGGSLHWYSCLLRLSIMDSVILYKWPGRFEKSCWWFVSFWN